MWWWQQQLFHNSCSCTATVGIDNWRDTAAPTASAIAPAPLATSAAADVQWILKPKTFRDNLSSRNHNNPFESWDAQLQGSRFPHRGCVSVREGMGRPEAAICTENRLTQWNEVGIAAVLKIDLRSESRDALLQWVLQLQISEHQRLCKQWAAGRLSTTATTKNTTECICMRVSGCVHSRKEVCFPKLIQSIRNSSKINNGEVDSKPDYSRLQQIVAQMREPRSQPWQGQGLWFLLNQHL